MKPAIWEVLSRAVGGTGVDLLVGVDDCPAALGFADAIPEVGYEFFKCPDLGLRRQIPVEVTDQADAERYVIEVVTGHMASVDLCRPSVTDLHLAIARTMAVANDEVVGQPILHVTHPQVVDVKDPGISLTGAAVVDDDIFPAPPSHGGSVDGSSCGGTQIIISLVGTKNPAPEPFFILGWRCWLQSLCSLNSRLFDRDRRRRGGPMRQLR